jgi:hypothetical protein
MARSSPVPDAAASANGHHLPHHQGGPGLGNECVTCFIDAKAAVLFGGDGCAGH